MTDRTCQTCTFCIENTCHRFPPTAAGWPSVAATDWCGEFKKSLVDLGLSLLPRDFRKEPKPGDTIKHRSYPLADIQVVKVEPETVTYLDIRRNGKHREKTVTKKKWASIITSVHMLVATKDKVFDFDAVAFRR